MGPPWGIKGPPPWFEPSGGPGYPGRADADLRAAGGFPLKFRTDRPTRGTRAMHHSLCSAAPIPRTTDDRACRGASTLWARRERAGTRGGASRGSPQHKTEGASMKATDLRPVQRCSDCGDCGEARVDDQLVHIPGCQRVVHAKDLRAQPGRRPARVREDDQRRVRQGHVRSCETAGA
jgi:hypothetical protein